MADHHLWKKGTADQRSIIMALLWMASHKEKSWIWKGQKFTVKPGQMVTSLESIRQKAGDGTTIQAVRSALLKFKKFDFITEETTKTGRLITITNWILYQSDNILDNIDNNKETTKEQHSNNIDTTPIKNVRMKECKNVEELEDEISLSATASGAGTKVKKTRSKKDPDLTKFQAWKIWIDIHRELGKTDPVAMGPDTAASSRLGAMVTTGKLEGEELKNIMMAYLRDTTPYVSGPGHPLSLLPKRINAYRNNIKADSKPITTPEQDAERARVRAILKAQEEREASERESDHD
jgi:hypothetical protein